MAQKETVNTFTGGMIMDTHPLTTPNNVLTNCLNGTLVTFNGNEMILQNDLGNAKILSKVNGDCVKLPDGFVPVGTAELGGIIYVSSFNPETKQCQIGCFPSPERNITSQESTSDNSDGKLNFLYNDLLDNNGTTRADLKPIKKGFKRIDLTDIELHSGDSFEINLIENQESIAPDVTGCDFKLVSISEDGNIMDLVFDFGTLCYYTAPNSGKLAMLISVKKLTSFSCNYSDLLEYGNYSSTADETDYTEVDDDPSELHQYKGNYVIYYNYDYYEWVEDTTNGHNKFIKCAKNSDIEYEKINEEKTYITYNNQDYIKESENGEEYFITGTIDPSDVQLEESENNTVFVKSKYIKIRKDDGSKYKWTSTSWSVNLRCIFNNKNKENLEYAELDGVIINNLIYSKQQLNNDILLTGLNPTDNKINLIVYPILKITQNVRGYSEDLAQSLILDTSLKEGEIDLTMWRYLYNSVMNLYFGFAGRLSSEKEITKVTILAKEYKELSLDFEIISITNQDSYFGSFFYQLELGDLLLYNKLYAITIIIDTNYCPSIKFYRWLYTNDVFNNLFYSDGILDYNDLYLKLNNLKCDLLIGLTNNDTIGPTSTETDYRDIVNVDEDEVIKDYMTYGYTKNNYDVEVPITFTYSTENELFAVDTSKIEHEIINIKAGNLITPYNYTDLENLILNSYKGQEKESLGGKIYSNAYKYLNYTDFLKIEDNSTNDTLHFTGRIYNKIKGDLRKIEIQGSEIFAPLVYNKSTAFKYNLLYDNGIIKPAYCLCLEMNPPLYVRYLGSMFKTKCTSQFEGRISMFPTQLIYSANILRTENPISYETIDSTLSIRISAINSNNKNESFSNIRKSGTPLYELFFNFLKDEGITNATIVPVLFTKISGKMSNIGEHSGNDDRFEDTSFNVKLTINSQDKTNNMHDSRSANDHSRNKSEVDSGSLFGTIGILTSSGELRLLNNITAVQNVTSLVKPIFTLLTQIYKKIGNGLAKIKYCLNSYDFQQDYQAKLEISGTVKSKIKRHIIISQEQTEGFDNWTNKNNLMIGDSDGDYIITLNFNSYKMFRVDLELEKEYTALLFDRVKNQQTPSTNINCINDLTIEIQESQQPSDYYILSKNNEQEYILSPINSFSDFTILYNNFTSVTQLPDGSKFNILYNGNSKRYENYFASNLTDSKLYINNSNNPSLLITVLYYESRLNGSTFDDGHRETTGHVLNITSAIVNKSL